MNGAERCPHCGAELSAAVSPGGLCPRCMLKMGLDGTGRTAETELAPATTDASHGTERPASIGPYKILETLGEGGMAIVYLAEQQERAAVPGAAGCRA